MRLRWLAVLAVALCVVAIPAAAANTPLHLVSQTSSTITLGWSQQQDVAAYVFYANGKRVSHTFDGNRISVTFSKVAGCVATCYGVEDLRSDGMNSYPLVVTQPPPTGASLYVASGGSDSSNGTASSPVRTLNRAYQLAACGSVIQVASGTYPEQAIYETSTGQTCQGNPVVMRAAPGTRPVFQHIRLGDFVGNCASNSPDNLTLSGFAVIWGIDIEHDATNIVVDGFEGGSFGMGGVQCGGGQGPPTNITIRNGEWGPCHSGGGAGQDCRNQYSSDPHNGQNKISDNATNVLIENNVIHDFTLQSPDHFECIWSNGGTNVTLRRNHIYNCVTSGIALPDTEMLGTWIFENNWWGDSSQHNAALKFGLGGGCPTGTVIVRFNSFAASNTVGDEEGGQSCGKIIVVGNILGETYGCIGGAQYRYNVILGSQVCGSTDRTISSLPYVNASGGATGNYHLGVASIADGFVPAGVPDSDLEFDWDGNLRVPPRTAGANNR